MGRILLVEPQRIVQQAIALALFPEHEVQAEEGFGSQSAGLLQGYELLILDAAALRDLGQMTQEVVRTIQSAKIPTLWLEEAESQRTPQRANLLIVKKPIQREAFLSAVADLLSPSGSPKKGAKPAAAPGSAAELSKGAAEKATAGASPQGSFQFIDLVDVVEEAASSGQKKESPRRPN